MYTCKKTLFWKMGRILLFVWKRMLFRKYEHTGIRTNYNLYRLRPIMRRLSRGHFLTDESDEFQGWLKNLRFCTPKKAVIMGNAPCLNDLSDELFNKMRDAGYFFIGLNRSIYKFQTEVLIWCDLMTIDDILKKRAVKSDETTVLHVRPERDHRLPVACDEGYRKLHEYWSKYHNFRNWKKSKLYMYRNGSTAALHLCYLLGIKDITLLGFSFDNREYFYKTNKYKKKKDYELLKKKSLTNTYGGYDTHRIVKEILEYLIVDEEFDIKYNGNSKFLKTVKGIRQITIDELDAGRYKK